MSSYTCADCGSLVDDESTTLHERHHEHFNALTEAVEAIVKVMPKKQPTNTQDKEQV